jgi:hypothetical protein
MTKIRVNTTLNVMDDLKEETVKPDASKLKKNFIL